MPQRLKLFEPSPLGIDFADGSLLGVPVALTRRTLGDLADLFVAVTPSAAGEADRLVYEVQSYQPVREGTSGGLFLGRTLLQSGRVGDEYFMTRGHYHERREAAEFYWCLQGQGVLLRMDARRQCRAEAMQRGSLHYIPANTAHRLINVGEQPLSVGACWPADAGHDYEVIAREGFSARVVCAEGQPRLVEVN